ncbi:Flp pilus assembly complex ATPase component TadA, partial [Achromobacter sp. Marseille-Q0513]|uniref:ATPase, T2SS/T4P/T4SS family n=1 Tax=Achromobacter sp. Marseille-Q0513 TaxID=2829161 RepID=UPI001B998874
DVYGGNGLFLDMVNEQQGRLYEVIDDRNYLLRWGSYITDNGPSITLRILDVDARVECVGLDTLGVLPTHEATLLRCLNSTGGAIIFGGVPGSGKTVSIGQLIVRLPQTRKINTLEDPVELQFRNALQATFARTLNGLDREALAAKLNALKRAAGTDAFLGEVRDDLTGDAFVD